MSSMMLVTCVLLMLTDKMRAWEEHYERLANVEFPWNEGDLTAAEPVEGPAVHISDEMVGAAVKKLKSGKAAGPSGVVGEMIKGCGEIGTQHLSRLINRIVKESLMPGDWGHSYMISLFKGKDSALERGNLLQRTEASGTWHESLQELLRLAAELADLHEAARQRGGQAAPPTPS